MSQITPFCIVDFVHAKGVPNLYPLLEHVCRIHMAYIHIQHTQETYIGTCRWQSCQRPLTQTDNDREGWRERERERDKQIITERDRERKRGTQTDNNGERDRQTDKHK